MKETLKGNKVVDRVSSAYGGCLGGSPSQEHQKHMQPPSTAGRDPERADRAGLTSTAFILPSSNLNNCSALPPAPPVSADKTIEEATR